MIQRLREIKLLKKKQKHSQQILMTKMEKHKILLVFLLTTISSFIAVSVHFYLTKYKAKKVTYYHYQSKIMN